MSPRRTAFSWGYWGWGSATRQLRQMFDSVEAERGYGPPLFVDIRWNRSVRAAGFQQRAFERVVGSDRYVWLRALGNRRIGTGRGGMQIADESAAETLLRLIEENAQRGRRVVFFCACESPRIDGRRQCHRDRVAELLIRGGRKNGIPIDVVEWPGGQAGKLDIASSENALASLRRGAKTVPLPNSAADDVAALPLGAIVTLRAGAVVQRVLVDGVVYRRGWRLKVFTPVSSQDTLAELRADSKRVRREFGRLERRS